MNFYQCPIPRYRRASSPLTSWPSRLSLLRLRGLSTENLPSAGLTPANLSAGLPTRKEPSGYGILTITECIFIVP